MSHNTGEDKTGGEKGIRVSVRNTAREAKDRNMRCKLNEIGKRRLKGLRENEGTAEIQRKTNICQIGDP